MKFFTVYRKVPVCSDGTLIDQKGGTIEFIVEEYDENGVVFNVVEYGGVDEVSLIGKITDDHPAGKWQNFDW